MALATMLCAATVNCAPGGVSAPSNASIRIDRIGAFDVGGRVVDDGKGGILSCDHGHIEYFVPEEPRSTALMMWHSSSAKVWQRRWDGGDGFVSIFLRRGYPVYLWDGPRVGRASWGCAASSFEPDLAQDGKNFLAWRFGPRDREWYPGVQFPVANEEAWNQATRARYAEFDTVENAEQQGKAGAQAADEIGPVVLVTSSAGGLRAMVAAIEASTSNIKAIIAYENPGFVFPEGEGPRLEPGPYGPIYVTREEFRKLARIPMQFVWGDHIEDSPGWVRARELNEAFVALVNHYGGRAEILSLPDAGLHGNTHLPFADMNNLAVADQLSSFLKRHGLER